MRGGAGRAEAWLPLPLVHRGLRFQKIAEMSGRELRAAGFISHDEAAEIT